jgi:serine/threonine protein kinase
MPASNRRIGTLDLTLPTLDAAALLEDDPHIGAVLGDQYRIDERMGSGGMGAVYRAVQLSIDRPVAVKLIAWTMEKSPEHMQRFRREAEALARLRHPNTVHMLDFGITDDGRLFMVMELLSGNTLEEHLAERGKLELGEALSAVRQIAQSISEAHALGIVHRDLKPSNVFIVDPARGGGVRLLDFGLAKLLDANTLTTDGMIAGTPSYIAPEAWRGTSKNLDHRIDVYALGVMVFRSLSGRLPPPSSDLLEICSWATTGPRPSLHALRASLPASIDPWIQRALAIDPAQRFQSIAEAFAALEATLATRPTAPY